ncbi:hypothetical protein Ade02nite_15960 [Paractinoplanes deccanensis]|uniref:DUF916 domain-containing protein n=1 Tax=Paractinoplanes deccanensis TaxID=113561 RepID=A0ABQ3XYZ8_9ACTN|nr:DUF916 domain-containing protein [Actinoplanes deccanensis]GID72955.1 hypothetical protein Ade02nite_15960 [Actinoplanes deccanensis]
MSPLRALLAVLVAVSGLVPGAAAAAPAAETLTWSVRPTPTKSRPDRPHFAYDALPGQQIKDSLRVRNYGAERLSLSVYASDALTTSSGALDLLPAGAKSTDVGRWAVLGKSRIDVPPGEFVDVPFTMTVPAKAESGDHTGGIVTSYLSPGTDGAGRAVTVDRRLGTRMYVRVGGDLQPRLEVSRLDASWSGTLNPFRPGGLHVGYTVTNTGNVRLGADQVVAVSFPGGETTLARMPELLPGDSLTFGADVRGVWPFFRTRAEVRLTPVPTRRGDVFGPRTAPATASAAVWTMPWPQLAVLLAAALAVAWLVWRRRRRRAAVSRQVEEAVRAALATRAP